MSEPTLICTTSWEVLRLGVCSDNSGNIRLSIDGALQKGIKSVDLLSFISYTHRKSVFVVPPS